MNRGDYLLLRAEPCRLLLEEGIALVDAGRYGPRLHALVADVTDRLDDLDEFLLRLHPVRDVREFVVVADLRRTLDRVIAAIPRGYRKRPPPVAHRDMLPGPRVRPFIRPSRER